MKKRVIGTGLAALVVAVGGACGGIEAGTTDTGASLDDAVREVFELRATEQNGKAWDLLVPEHQKMISRTQFVQCGDATSAATLESVDVEESYDEKIVIPGTDVTVTSKAAVVKIVGTLMGRSVSDSATVHYVDVGGEWRWMLSEEAVADCVESED